jgi:glycosyltransferase involved in cell wall biosynthesis
LGPSKRPWSYSRKLAPWLSENLARFDVIIIHGLWLYQSFGATLALKTFKDLQLKNGKSIIPKVFVMPHGMLDPYFQNAPGRRIKAIRNWIYWKLIEGGVVNNADVLLFTSKEECRLAEESFRPYRPKYKAIIGLGIAEPPAFNQKMYKSFVEKCLPIKDRCYILFLGRIDVKKGIDNLVNAYRIVVGEISAAEKAQPPARVGKSWSTSGRSGALPLLVIAGPGLETPFGIKLQEMVNSNPALQESVFFPGMLDGVAKWGAFYGAEAFILPSHQENFGIAVAEALACSKPVLVSSAVNISHEIKENDGGFVEPDSLNGTCDLIRKWHKLTFEERSAMSKQARRCFEICFAVAPAIDRLIYALDDSTKQRMSIDVQS